MLSPKLKEEWKKLRTKLNLVGVNVSNSLATKEQGFFFSLWIKLWMNESTHGVRLRAWNLTSSPWFDRDKNFVIIILKSCESTLWN